MPNLMQKKWIYFMLSLVLILPGLYGLANFGLKLSIDFTGGNLFEYRFTQSVASNEISDQFKKLDINVSSITNSGENQFIIKSKPVNESKVIELKKNLVAKYGSVEELRIENVGPVIGAETTKNSLTALFLVTVLIVLYIALSFRKVPRPASSWRFGVTAVVALLHDCILLLGAFSLLGHYFGVEIDTLFVTALLTVIGFSVHDTIVVFDRIRENLSRHLSKSFTEVANISIIQTLGRSLNTSLTVVLVLLALLLFGGESIKWFVVALLVGIISGTYSSIFNATALLVLWEEKLGH